MKGAVRRKREACEAKPFAIATGVFHARFSLNPEQCIASRQAENGGCVGVCRLGEMGEMFHNGPQCAQSYFKHEKSWQRKR